MRCDPPNFQVPPGTPRGRPGDTLGSPGDPEDPPGIPQGSPVAPKAPPWTALVCIVREQRSLPVGARTIGELRDLVSARTPPEPLAGYVYVYRYIYQSLYLIHTHFMHVYKALYLIPFIYEHHHICKHYSDNRSMPIHQQGLGRPKFGDEMIDQQGTGC